MEVSGHALGQLRNRYGRAGVSLGRLRSTPAPMREELRCPACGFGAIVARPLARCPMCGGGEWLVIGPMSTHDDAEAARS
jgi:hypothetical protein